MKARGAITDGKGNYAIDEFELGDPGPNEVMVELDLRSEADARGVLQSPRLRGFFDQTGVEVYPPVFIGEVQDDLST